MYAILHLPTATLVHPGPPQPYKKIPMSFPTKADAGEFLTHAIIKNSNGTWEGVYWDQSSSGSLQYKVPKYYLEVIEVPDV